MAPGNLSSAVTINRTLVPIVGATNETITAFEGAAAGLELVATGMQTDVKGNLYFVNVYPAQQAGLSVITGLYGQGWYDGILTGAPSGGVSNICSMTSAGQVRSLISTNSTYSAPEYTFTTEYLSAKWVDFFQTFNSAYSFGAYAGGFAGLNSQGAIYYYGSPGAGGDPYVNGLVFYKLYSKK